MKSFIKNLKFIPAIMAAAVVYAGCTKSPDLKIYGYPAPEPKGMFPDSGYAGFNEVTIDGSSFGDYKNAVKVFFNGIQADTIVSCVDGKIVVKVPGDAISGKVSLQVWTHMIDSVGSFKVVPPPVVKTASKDIGLPGETVEIAGTGFGADPAKVKVDFNGTTAAITEITDTLLKVALPQGFTSGNIQVSVNNYPVTGPLFRAVASVPNPVYWLAFEGNLADKMGGTAATYSYKDWGKPMSYAAGVNGQAVVLPGASNFLTTNNQFLACPPQISKHANITVSCWVNWSNDSNWVQEPVFDFGQARGLRMALMTRMQTNQGPNMLGRLIFEKIPEFTPFTAFDAKADRPLPAKEWHHVAMTISTDEHIQRVYMDGQKIAELALDVKASPTLFNHNKVYIGAPTNGVVKEPAFGGMVDEFEIFDEALNGDQIFALFYKNRQ
ncbi:LamG-like jellyroll fold domain-containing protein [Longitalea luteola]|uniref:LamG-like jellyroll fold domain-containing protein n=1 Tax=Longitalea luteola TaxID=2812563 RepID=UPI001A975C0D|nr:LamG-like jellyroll fold domain-containing protein [Longitalea luteola]